jgi:hypothetical protein
VQENAILEDMHNSSVPVFASVNADEHRRAVVIGSKIAIFVTIILAVVSLTAYMQMPRPNRVIYVNGGEYICSDVGVNNALKALPSTGGIVDLRGCQGTMTWASNVFSGVSALSGELLLGSVTVTLSAQQLAPSQWKIEGIPSTAGANGFSDQISKGTVFVWSGAPNTAMFVVFDQFGVILDGLSFYCGTFASPVAGCTDVLIDSDDTARPYPGADFIQVLNTSHYNFTTGISLNSATRGCGRSGCDTSAVTIQNANFGSKVSGSEGIVSWSVNGGSSSLFDRIFCQGVVACIEIKDNIGGTIISRLDAGDLAGTNAAAILLSGRIFQQLIIRDSRMENDLTNENSRFLRVTGAGIVSGVLNLTNNQFNGGRTSESPIEFTGIEISSIFSTLTINSIGNSGSGRANVNVSGVTITSTGDRFPFSVADPNQFLNWRSGTFTAGSRLALPVGVYGHNGAPKPAYHFVQDTAILSGGTLTIALTNAAAFTSATSYNCHAEDTTTPANTVKPIYTSGSGVTFVGSGTDSFNYSCSGF